MGNEHSYFRNYQKKKKSFPWELSDFSKRGLFADNVLSKSVISCKFFYSSYSGQPQVIASGERNSEKIDFEAQWFLFWKIIKAEKHQLFSCKTFYLTYQISFLIIQSFWSVLNKLGEEGRRYYLLVGLGWDLEKNWSRTVISCFPQASIQNRKNPFHPVLFQLLK